MDEREIELMQVRIRHLENLVLALVTHIEAADIPGTDEFRHDVAESVESAALGNRGSEAWNRYFRGTRLDPPDRGGVNPPEARELSERARAPLQELYGDRLGLI